MISCFLFSGDGRERCGNGSAVYRLGRIHAGAAEPAGGADGAETPGASRQDAAFLGSRRAVSFVIDLVECKLVVDNKHQDGSRQSVVMTPEIAFFLREYLSVALRSASEDG